jgi:MarR family
VLLVLRRQGPPYSASPSYLADALGLTRGALSARLAPIEQAGLITRATDEADRRRCMSSSPPPGTPRSSSTRTPRGARPERLQQSHFVTRLTASGQFVLTANGQI